MALDSTRNPTPPPASPFDAQAGEVVVRLDADDLAALPEPVQPLVRAHLAAGEPFIAPADDGAYPRGIVAAVRDRRGLIGWHKDGAGRRIPGTLADVKGKAKAKRKRAAKAKPTTDES